MRKKQENNKNKNNNYNTDIPDYSSKLNNSNTPYPNPQDDYDEFAKELNPDDFE
ncbi:hypothetical protein [Vallitalea maricola]|uniref:Uncharacterized protein n=1 Tax=Vallitalea maricola TaxID=3074433 RepID=A0ACB5UM85_9FIRM|nr:hypothetical protein AN2V17_32120 [Vallitalea sp. AN17-2]